MHRNIIPAILVSMLFVSAGHADGLPIEPGQWEMTSTMTMSMMPQPQTNTAIECIEEDVLDPSTFNMDEENPCDITDVMIESATARWNISCPVENGAKMEGQWEVTSHGETLSGKGQMTTEIGGQEMGFDMSWEGKRIGDCE